MKRRDFIRTVIASSAALGWSPDRIYAQAPDSIPASRRHVVREPLHMLRDGHRYDIPSPTEFRDLVIVGAGATALFAAYDMPEVDLVCLEKEPRTGGNAQRGLRNGIYMNEGSAYIDMESDLVDFMQREFNLSPMLIGGYDAYVLHTTIVRNLYRDDFSGLPYPQVIKDEFRRFQKLLAETARRLRSEAHAVFDEEETIDPAVRREILELDSIDFEHWLRDNHFPDEVIKWCNIYCPPQISSFPRYSSALVSILWMASVSSYDKVGSWPGGLAVMAEALAAGVRQQGHDRLRTGTCVVHAANTADRKFVDVTYLQGGRLHTIRCRTCIWGAHKHVARYAIPEMPQEQKEAIGKIDYLDISMINLCYDRTIYNKDFITWLDNAPIQNFMPADWVLNRDRPRKNKPQILSCDWATPPEHRPNLLNDSWVVEQCQATAHRMNEIFPGSIDHLEEMRVLVRAHSWVNYAPGYVSNVMPFVSADIGRIVMAATDHGSFEFAMESGIDSAERAKDWLNQA